MFNKKKFGELLVKIQGKRSINAYARDSGVSAAYISKLQRGLYDKAPSPGIIQKLADNLSEVSYANLMEAAGHILPFEDSEKLRAKQLYLIKNASLKLGLPENVDEVISILSGSDKEELDNLIDSSSTEEIHAFVNDLTNLDNLYNFLREENYRYSEKMHPAKVQEVPDVYNMTEVSPQTVKIPVLGEIACGDPIHAEENFKGYRYKSPDGLPKGQLYILEAKGDSMEPTIPNGSEVLIRKQAEVESGEIAAVLVNGDTEATLKRVKRQGDILMLMPDNTNYDPIVVSREYPIKIIGKAIEITRKL